MRDDALDRQVSEDKTDLVESSQVQCLDVWETVGRRKTRQTRLTHVHNRARVHCGEYTIDHLDLSRLIEGRTILADDFNARSPTWVGGWQADRTQGRQNS